MQWRAAIRYHDKWWRVTRSNFSPAKEGQPCVRRVTLFASNSMNISRCAVLVAVSAAFLAHPQTAPSNVEGPAPIQETFANSHRWFELRAEATAQSPLHRRAVLAAAFNDPAAGSCFAA